MVVEQIYFCKLQNKDDTGRVFHGFGKAKLLDGVSILGSSQFTLLLQLSLKTILNLKVVKINSKVISSLH